MFFGLNFLLFFKILKVIKDRNSAVMLEFEGFEILPNSGFIRICFRVFCVHRRSKTRERFTSKNFNETILIRHTHSQILLHVSSFCYTTTFKENVARRSKLSLLNKFHSQLLKPTNKCFLLQKSEGRALRRITKLCSWDARLSIVLNHDLSCSWLLERQPQSNCLQ